MEHELDQLNQANEQADLPWCYQIKRARGKRFRLVTTYRDGRIATSSPFTEAGMIRLLRLLTWEMTH